MSEGIVRHVEHGNKLVNGYPGTRVPDSNGFSGSRHEKLTMMDGRRSCMSSWLVYAVRVLRWIVFCVFEGFLEVAVRHPDHGDTLLSGYLDTRPEKPGCVFEGFMEGVVRHADHGETLLSGYPARKTRRIWGQTRSL